MAEQILSLEFAVVKANILEQTLSHNENPAFGLTKELITRQFETNWNLTLDIYDFQKDSDQPSTVFITGEMGAGKSTMLQILGMLHKIEDPNSKFKLIKIKDNRAFARTQSKVEASEIQFGTTIDKIVDEIRSFDIQPGDKVGLSEIQFLLGGTIPEIHKNFKIIEELILVELQADLVIDSLKTLASGKPALASLYLEELFKLRQQKGGQVKIVEPIPCNVFDENEKPDINMRSVAMFENGNFVFPIQGEPGTGKVADMTLADRMALITQFRTIVEENPDLSFFIKNLPFGEDGKLVEVISIPIAPDDIEFTPGDINIYIAVHFPIIEKAMKKLGWQRELDLYIKNRESTGDLRLQIRQYLSEQEA